MMGGTRNILLASDGRAIIRNDKGDITIDAEAAAFFSTHNFYIQARGDTTTVFARDKQTNKQTKLSRLVMQAPDEMVVDHINGDPLDNRRANLRVVTQQDNRRNSTKPRSGATSRFKGVCKPSGRNRWRATIYNGRLINLGAFSSEVEAARAYDAAARELFGDCAAVNFPNDGEQSAHRRPTGTYAATRRVQSA